MITLRTAIRPALLLTLALSCAVGCDDSDDKDSDETAADASVPDATATTPDASAADAAAAKKTVVEIAVGDSRFSTLVAAVTKAGLVETLSGPGPFTVFAPTNDAFTAALAKLNKTLDELSAEDLKPILTYHVVAGTVLSKDIKPGPVTTVNGKTATISVSGSSVKINDATVTTADIEASNGVIHVIDAVLLPPQ